MNPKRWKIEDLAIGMKVRRAKTPSVQYVPAGTNGVVVGFFPGWNINSTVQVRWEGFSQLEEYDEVGWGGKQLIEIIDDVDEWAEDFQIVEAE